MPQVQDFKVEVDSLELLERYLRLAVATVLNSDQELALKAAQGVTSCIGQPDPKKHFPVLMIGGWFLPKEVGKENTYFLGYKPWTTFRSSSTESATDKLVKVVLGMCKLYGARWANEFTARFGSGYHEGFNHFDGTVETGYKLSACRSFPEMLSISIVHMYYGK